MPENRPIATPLENEPPAERSGGDAPGPPKDNAAGSGPQPFARWFARLALVAILLGAAFPRFLLVGFPSFWYDEVVTIRLARAPGAVAMVRLLGEIDATRAPLHPLILHTWLRLWDPIARPETSARVLSGLFGLATILVLYRIARRIAGEGAGLWAATLGAISPLLVEYDREARMYALLTLLSASAWWNLLAFRDSAGRGRMLLQVALMGGMIYAHPLGMVMAGTWTVGWWLDRGRSRLTAIGCLAVCIGVALVVAPWVGRYFDHAPESTTESGRAIVMLLGMPIGFLGGDSRMLAVCAGLISLGLLAVRVPGLTRERPPAPAWPIAAWLIVPPTFLYLYSLSRSPIFGPARYNAYVAPAYLALLAAGLTRLNRVVQGILAASIIPLLVVGSMPALYGITEGRKADWRAASAWLDDKAPEAPVLVIAPAPGRNFEVEVARYYLGNRRTIIAAPGATLREVLSPLDKYEGRVIVSASLRDRSPIGQVPPELNVDGRAVRHHDFRGLRLFEIRVGP